MCWKHILLHKDARVLFVCGALELTALVCLTFGGDFLGNLAVILYFSVVCIGMVMFGIFTRMCEDARR